MASIFKLGRDKRKKHAVWHIAYFDHAGKRMTRARIYIMSYMTGPRRSELASLTAANFDLGATPATLTLAATVSKHRKTDVLPLHPGLVVMLGGSGSGT